MDKKILITGSEGFIGNHLKKELPDAELFDLKFGDDLRDNLPQEDYTHIIHLAALKSVPMGEKNPYQFIETNCWGTLNLVRNYPNARIINISSSSAEYCLGVYGITKRFTESLGSYHPNYLSVRLFNVFGEGQPYDTGALIPRIMRSKILKNSINVYGDGSVVRDFTYVGDVVQDIVQLMNSDLRGLIDCGYGEPVSVLDLIQEITRGNIQINFLPNRPKDIPYSKSKRSIHRTFGRSEGLLRTEEWTKNTLGQ